MDVFVSVSSFTRVPKTFWKIGVLFLAFVGFLLGGNLLAEEKAFFQFNQLDKALEEAQATQRPILLHFYSPSCPPCRRMESEVFTQANVQETAAAYYIIVGINGKEVPETVRQLGVQMYPCDFILTPERKIVALRRGFQGPQAYLDFLTQTAQTMQFQPKSNNVSTPAEEPAPKFEGKLVSHTETTELPQLEAKAEPQLETKVEPQLEAKVEPQLEAKAELQAPGFAMNLQPKPLAKTEAPKREETTDVSKIAPEKIAEPFMLDGFCPVTLVEKRAWKAGDAGVSLVYQGAKYLFASEKARDTFQKKPEHYAVALQGTDVVVLHETQQTVAGTRRFGTRYGSQNYVFSSEENRAKFHAKPEFYESLIRDSKHSTAESPKF